MHVIIRHRKLILSILASLIIGFILLTMTAEKNQEELSFTEIETPTENKTNSKVENDQNDDKIIVDVKGAVKKPGIYEMHEVDRIKQAIDMAEGFTNDAQIESVNLAQRVQDEMVIYVEREGEPGENLIAESHQSQSVANPSGSGPQVNINTATQEELTSLSGIGPSKAEAIVKHREENGAFQSEENLTDVTGIGEKTFENIKDSVTIR